MAEEILYVRLKPLNKKKGHVVQRHTRDGKRYLTGVWYKVDAKTADSLRGIRQLYRDKESPAMFDICTKAEAEALDKAEQRVRVSAPGTVDEAADLTTRNLGRGGLNPGRSMAPAGSKPAAKAPKAPKAPEVKAPEVKAPEVEPEAEVESEGGEGSKE